MSCPDIFLGMNTRNLTNNLQSKAKNTTPEQKAECFFSDSVYVFWGFVFFHRGG